MTETPAQIGQWRERFEALLETQLPTEDTIPEVLHRAMRYSALAAGKRFRPVLVYASGTALNVAPERLDPLAFAIELIHAYSLIHDDLPAMDDDDLRRGRPTCHKAFDEATAILAGDALQALAFEILARGCADEGERGLRIIQSLARACGSLGMAGGQSLDLQAVGRSLTLEKLEQMHRLKTGALIQASVCLPGLLAGVPETVMKQLLAYGDAVGLAFQVHDEILDVTGDSELIGKPVLADEALNKPTFPSLLGLDNSARRAEELRLLALDALDGVPGDTTALAWLADYVIRRDR